ncbi:unnamed protein product [Calypogeia fissa]
MTTEINRAVQLSKPNGEPSENYVLNTLPKPTASPKNVVVRMVLRPVNPTDLVAARLGFWAHLDLRTVVGGSEGTGIVHEVGKGVTKVTVGQRVIPLTFSRYYSQGYGLWRDYVEVPEIDLVPVPEDMPDEVAAQFIINPWAAYGMLNRLQVPKDEYLLQTAAGSVLGRQIISLAKHYGIKTINVVRRDEQIQELKNIGADYVINSKKEDLKARVMEITKGKGAYAALDAVATESTRLMASSIRDGGQVLVYGALSGNTVTLDLTDLMRSVSVAFFLVTDYKHDLPEREKTVKAVMELLSKKIIHPVTGKTLQLEEFKEAIMETEREGRGGKVLLASYD